ncbi:MAG: hypothetical protein ACK4N5_01430 [Myxococcales bacterium]
MRPIGALVINGFRTKAAPVAAVLMLGVVLGGCQERGAAGTDAVLSSRFPERVAEVLQTSGPLPTLEDGAPRLVTDTLSARWAASANGPLQLAAGPLKVEVVETGAQGLLTLGADGVLRASSAGVTRYWKAHGGGVEEWLLFENPTQERLSSWQITGARLRKKGPLVELVGEDGEPHLAVSAPAAYGPGGEPVAARLEVEGDRIVLYARADRPGPLLVDPWWVPTGTMGQARSEHIAAELPGGLVLGAGGFGTSCPREPTASAELFDPSTGAWTSTGPMAAARSRHTVTRLANTQILVASGLGMNDVLRSAEIYTPPGGGSGARTRSMRA